MAIPRRIWMDYNGTPGSGTPINNAELQAVIDPIEFGWEFDNHLVSWTATSVNPVIGNGTATGQSFRIGDLMAVWIRIVMGSSTTYGTGNYSFNLPATYGGGAFFGMAMGTNAGTANYTTGCAVISTTTFGAVVEGANTAWGPTLPFTWGSGDTMALFVAYQIA